MKEALYRTAIVAQHVLTHNGEHDLNAGDVVGVSYIGHQPNKLYRRNEAVYAITRDGAFWGHLYANGLKDFVL